LYNEQREDEGKEGPAMAAKRRRTKLAKVPEEPQPAPPLRDGSTRVVSASEIRGIVDRKRAEDALRQSEARFRLMGDHAPVLIWMSGTDKLCTWFNKPWLDFVGRSMEQELGNGWTENIHPGDFDRCLQTYNTSFDAREPFSMEYRLKRHDGEYRWVLDSGIALYGADDEFTGYIGSCIDITERRQAEEAIAETYRKLKLAITAGRMATWSWDPRKDVVATSENFREICGLSSVDGREHGESLLHPEDLGHHREIVDKALKQGTPYQSIFRLVRPDNGQVVWLDLRAVPLTGGDGQVATLSGVAIDITERKRAEEKLRQSEARMQAILNTAADAILTMDIHGTIQSVNPAGERMFGYTAAEMIGHNVGLLMPSPYREEHDGYLAQYLQTGEKHIIGGSRELEARHKDGSIFPVHLVVSEIEDRKLFTGVLRDMTVYKRLEREVVEIASRQQQQIGQDLHDSVAQELTALNLLAGDLAETLGPDDAAGASKFIERIKQGLQRSQQALRAVLRGLLPVAVEGQGLMAALAELASRTQQQASVTCTFDCPEPVSLGDNLTATHLYLIAQEAVHNALKHSKPQHIWISLQWNPGLVLRVQCDGMSIPARPLVTEGLGLRTMRNRAAIINAHLTIEPAEPTGTLVTCRLVRKNHEPEQE
jgi:PAS domain S-box-containing protein